MKNSGLSGDFALAASHHNEERDYWLNKLAGELPNSFFPYDRKISAQDDSYSLDNLTFQFNQEVSSWLIKLSNGSDSNLYMILTASLDILLHIYSGSDEVIIGTPVLNQESDDDLINTILVLRNNILEGQSFREHLLSVRETILEAQDHQNYPFNMLVNQLGISAADNKCPLFDAAILLKNIHDKNYLSNLSYNICFAFLGNSDSIKLELEYNSYLYHPSTVERIFNHLQNILKEISHDINRKITDMAVLSREDKTQLLETFNNTATPYPSEKTIHQLFEEVVSNSPNTIVVVFNDQFLTYRHLDEKANQLANFLCDTKEIGVGDQVALVMERSVEQYIAIMGVLKAGAAYIPIDTSLPQERLRIVLEDSSVGVVISQKKFIDKLSRLQWDCRNFHSLLVIDQPDMFPLAVNDNEELTDMKKLWDYVAGSADDDIEAGGWISSYNGKAFSKLEMDEYCDNALKKLLPFLHKEMNVLEIGCASGITMFRIATHVKFYLGTDLSVVTIERNKERIKNENLHNVQVECFAAHQIDQIKKYGKLFDLIIMNSVIQAFFDYNYLKDVLSKAIDLLSLRGIIFLGDLMDNDSKKALIQDLEIFKKETNNQYMTKTEFSSELFVSRGFLEDLRHQITAIQTLDFSSKIFTVENECTKFRFDAILHIDKTIDNSLKLKPKHKYQNDFNDLNRHSIDKCVPASPSCHAAYVMYTSGSTGVPKGVVVEHRAIINTLIWSKNYYGFGSDDAFMQIPSFFFDSSISSIFIPLICGTKLVQVPEADRFNLEVLKHNIKYNHVTYFLIVPAFFNVLLDEIPQYLSDLRMVTVAGEDFTPELARKHFEKLPRVRLFNEYGPTENSVNTTVYELHPDNIGVLIGQPIANVSVYILSKNLALLPLGVPGELHISGPGLARGYLNNPQLTNEKFISNPYYNNSRMYSTGDAARWMPDGNIEFLGRIDSQVKIRGFRIEIRGIENHLLRHHDVKEAVVLVHQVLQDNGNPNTQEEKYICAYIVPSHSGNNQTAESIDDTQLREYLANRLPDYMIPSYFVFIPAVPRLATGKVDHKALPDPQVDKTGLIPPRNEDECKLVTIWAEILKIKEEDIGINTNFFEAGGNSLRATIMISRVHKELSVKVPLSEIFRSQTIKGVSDFIQSQEKVSMDAIPKTEAKDYYFLSSAQNRLYILQQLDLLSTGYNSPSVVMLEGTLELEKLSSIFDNLIDMHLSLKTSFPLQDGIPVQKINKEVSFDIEYYGIKETSQLNSLLQNKDINWIDSVEQAISKFIRPFELSSAPLFRVGFINLTPQRYIFLFDIHHIIADGTSANIFINEFMKLYQGKSLSKLRLQYTDFSEWQNAQDNGESQSYNRQKEFWLQQFEEEIPTIQLPIDFTRPLFQSFEGNRVVFELDSRQTTAIHRLTREEGATPFITLFTIFNILLHKLTGQEDILVGAPVAGRKHADLDRIIGFFVNTLVLRNKPQAQKSFIDFLKEVKTSTLQAFSNQDYQYEDLVEEIVVERDVSRNPLFDVMFALQNVELEKVNISGITLKPYPFENHTAQFDFILQGMETGDTLRLEMIYCTKLFKHSTVQRFANYFQRVLDQVLQNPKLKIAELKLMNSTELTELMAWSNGDAQPIPQKTIHQIFEETAQKNPGETALVMDGKTMSYSQLNEKANQLAYLLRDRGVKPGSIVAVIFERSFDMVIAILAVLKAGGAYLPIDPEYPQERILMMLENSKTSLIISQKECSDTLSFTALRNTNTIFVQPYKTATREQIMDMDKLPKPDRTLIDYERYHKSIGIALVKHTVHIQATRGCPYNCAYCHKIWPKKHVVRSAEHIFEEVKACYDSGLRRFVFIDDIFNLKIENSWRFMQKIIDNKMDIQMFFPNGLRGDILTKEFIDLMVEAGTIDLTLALETASPRIQKLIQKNLNLEKFSENIEYITQKYPHIISEMESMIGFPTETEEEAMMTLDFVMKQKWLHFPNLHILKIYPNTDMCDLALKSGIPMDVIEESTRLAFHQLPLTLPFSKEFVQQFQSAFLNDYILKKERLLEVLPKQIKLLTEDELIQKYNSYVPMVINNFSDLLRALNITKEELGGVELLSPDHMSVPNFSEKIKTYFPKKEKDPDPFKILLLDLSQQFSADLKDKLYNVTEEPLGLMYLMTYLNEMLGKKVKGKVLKSNIDFDDYREMKTIIEEFKPDLIGLRTLSYYRDFFHQCVSLMRQWGVQVPIIAGGPYATTDYQQLLQDTHLDVVVLGEGEHTLAHLVKEMIDNNKKLPHDAQLEKINGIAFIKKKDRETLEKLNRDVILVDKLEDRLLAYPYHNPVHVNQPNDLVYTIFTSGSTGTPKGLMLEHRNLVNLLTFQTQYTNLDFSRVLQFVTISFDVSFQEIFSTLLAGGRLYLISRETQRDPTALFQLVEKNNIKTLFLPVSFLKFVLNEEEYSRLLPSNVDHVVTAGEQLIVTDVFKNFLIENKIYLHNHYGPAETHVVTTFTMQPSSDIPQLPSIGKPISNTSIYIVSKEMTLQPMGIAGELLIGGAQVGRGYLHHPQLTVEKFISYPLQKEGNVYRTGDLAKWLPDGLIQFLGRIDHQVKIRGFRIEPGEIEHQLLNHKMVGEAVVMVKNNHQEASLTAYIVPETAYRKTSDLIVNLRTYLSKRLPDYMIPAFFILLERIPLTPNGKLDSNQLLSINIDASYSPPRNEMEERVQHIWSIVLNKEKETISIDDNFFSLGGHSLNATIMMSHLHKEFGVKLSLTDIFQTPTIAGLTSCISNSGADIFHDIQPTAPMEYYPLSSAQKRLYFLEQFENIGTSYNMPSVVKIDGHLDRGQLNIALNKLIQRHESLRTSFIKVNDEPVQKIFDSVDFEIEELQLYHLEGSQNLQQEIKEIMKTFVRPFDLDKAPLLRVGLGILEEDEHFLFYDMHHIISDGTSLEIMTEEFAQLYSGIELKPLKLQYKDFSQWQNSMIQSGQMAHQEQYWLQLFNTRPPLLNFPTDFPRPKQISFQGNRRSCFLDHEYTQKLHHTAQAQEVTLFIYLFAAFNVLLFKYSGQEDIVLGGGIMGRPHVDLHRIIGFFVNSLAIRSYPSKDKIFNDFLAEVKESCLAAFENQDVQFESIVDKLKWERDASRNPLFDMQFVFQNYVKADMENTQFQNVKFTAFGNENMTSKFDLDVSAFEQEGRIYFSIGYCTDLFKDSTAQEIAENYIEILKQTLDNEPISLDQIKIINDLVNVDTMVNEDTLGEFVF